MSAAERREQLLVIARELFAERGFEGTSVEEIAATAIQHSKGDTQVVVVHYDTDFDHLASVEPRLATEWIVPRGSVA